jgi:hypothetical protein
MTRVRDKRFKLRDRLILVVILMGLSALQACAQSHESVSRISLQRTACFGVCPVYSVSIYPDGLVEFHGERFVAAVGEYSHSVNPANFDRLAQFAREIDFFSFAAEYRVRVEADNSITAVSDLPSRITTVETETERKSVLNYFAGPQELEDFENLIDQLTDSARWVGQ